MFLNAGPEEVRDGNEMPSGCHCATLTGSSRIYSKWYILFSKCIFNSAALLLPGAEQKVLPGKTKNKLQKQ